MASNGVERAITIYPAISVEKPINFVHSKYAPTDAIIAIEKQINCLIERPNIIFSLYSVISLGTFTSIAISTPPLHGITNRLGPTSCGKNSYNENY